jgi:hypothetical protein
VERLDAVDIFSHDESYIAGPLAGHGFEPLRELRLLAYTVEGPWKATFAVHVARRC